MKNSSYFVTAVLRSTGSFAAAVFATVMLLMAPVAGFTQEITGAIRGTVVTPSGDPAAGELVTVTDTRTGSSRSATTNDAGSFNIRGLTIGGPYTLRVDSSSYEDYLVTDIYTNLSSAATFAIALQVSDAAIEEIVVTSRMVETAPMAVGPGSSFNLEEIDNLPSIARQIRDVIRVDPRVSIGRASGGDGYGVSCLGGGVKNNSFTIDGISSADGFGLNASGNSARNTFPIPYDALGSASVEFAPLDVQYGRFTGCNVNVITKSGTNEFHGSATYLFNDDGMTGDSIDGTTVISEPFEDTNWALELGGPIIKDKLFFYVAYEETDEGGTQNNGPIGAGFANEDFITEADANTISSILQSQYGRDTLGIVRALPKYSERTFARLDWNINDDHRAEFTYTDLLESNLEEDDYGFNGFAFGDNFEEEGTEQEALSLRVFSNWTDNFSTEVRVSSLEVQDVQGPQGGGEAQDDNKPRIQVQDGAGNNMAISGPGFFRSANDLKYELQQVKLAGDYVAGDHTITVGYELDRLDVFNLFIQDGTGTITFADIAALQAGTASSITGNGSFTGDPRDAGATWERDIHSFYLQDEWQYNDALTFIAGVRYDTYQTDTVPPENPIYVQRYGFTNTTSFDGLDIVMPRVGLTYDLPYDQWGNTQLSLGFGIFSGGDPSVHISNGYQNFGGAIGFGGHFSSTCASDPNVLQVIDGSGNFTGIPACVSAAQQADASGNTARAHATDPNFQLPENRRLSLGINHIVESDSTFWNDWDIQFDYIYSKSKSATDWVDLTLTPNGVILPDGRPQMMAVDPLLPGCNATFIGLRDGFANAGPAGGPCDAGSDDQDILLTNGPSGETTSVSIQMEKSFTLSDATSLDLRLGYAYTDAITGHPAGSSTAESSYEENAQAVINRTLLARSPYANKHNIILYSTLRHYFFDNNPTSISLFLRHRSGRPFSFVYDNNTPTTLFGDSDNEERNLFYVPTGIGDPLVDFSGMSTQQVTDLFLFLNRTGLSEYGGKIAPRNGWSEPWTTDVDIRIRQDFPVPWGDGNHSFQVYLDIENVLNIFSDGNNVQKFKDGGDIIESIPVLDAALTADGRYAYTNFNPGGGNSTAFGFNPINDVDVDDSVYRIQFGVKYAF